MDKNDTKGNSGLFLLWWLIDDIRDRVQVLLNEIENIHQSSKYLSNLSGEEREDIKIREEEFFGAIENLSSLTKTQLKEEIFYKLRVERLAIQMNASKIMKKGDSEELRLQSEIEKLTESERKVYEKRIREWDSWFLYEEDEFKEHPEVSTQQNPVKSTIDRRFSYLKKLDSIIDRIRLYQKALSERMEAFRPYPSIPNRFYRKEVRRNSELTDQIFREYEHGLLALIGNFVIAEEGQEYFNLAKKKFDLLLVCDHSNKTIVKHYKTGKEKNKEEILHVIVQAPYWLMEIPRYIPVLAHEMAHSLLDYIVKDMIQNEASIWGNKITFQQDFELLIQDLKKRVEKVLYFYPKVKSYYYSEESIYDPINIIISEVMADLFSFFVAGPAYLFVLFFSIIHEEQISMYVSPNLLPAPYVRLRLSLDIVKNLFEHNPILSNWVAGIEELLKHYHDFFSSGGDGQPEDSDHFKAKIEFFDNLFVAIRDPIRSYLRSIKKDINGFEWKVKSERDDVIVKRVQQVLLEANRDGYLVAPDLYVLTEEETLIRNIPSVTWSFLLSNFEKSVLKRNGSIPEGRILRALSTLNTGKREIDYELGDCYEILFYDVIWSRFRNNPDALGSFNRALKDGVENFKNDAKTKYEPLRNDPLVFTMFGEYDFFLIKGQYSARAYFENWPPHPENSKTEHIPDDTYHIKRFTYREIQKAKSFIAKKETELLQRLEDAFNKDKCLAFTQVECTQGKDNDFLQSIVNNEIFKQYQVGLLESTAWDDFAVFWRLDDGLETLIKIVGMLIEEKDKGTLSHSITHLMYDTIDKEKISQMNQSGSAHALTRLILPHDAYDAKSSVKKIMESNNDDTRITLYSAFGTCDVIIEWEFLQKKPFPVIKKKLNELIKKGYLENCVTSFLDKI